MLGFLRRKDGQKVETSTTLKCTYCGGIDFLEGPSGGMATNVLCANPNCRHWFNHSPFGLEDLKRQEPTKDERAAEIAQEKDHQLATRRAVYEEGRAIYAAGRPAWDCVRTRNNRYGFYSADGGDVMRLAGWLDAREGRNELAAEEAPAVDRK